MESTVSYRMSLLLTAFLIVSSRMCTESAQAEGDDDRSIIAPITIVLNSSQSKNNFAFMLAGISSFQKSLQTLLLPLSVSTYRIEIKLNVPRNGSLQCLARHNLSRTKAKDAILVYPLLAMYHAMPKNINKVQCSAIRKININASGISD